MKRVRENKMQQPAKRMRLLSSISSNSEQLKSEGRVLVQLKPFVG